MYTHTHTRAHTQIHDIPLIYIHTSIDAYRKSNFTRACNSFVYTKDETKIDR